MLLGLLVSDDVPDTEGEELEMAIFDISRAHFMAPMDCEACIEFASEIDVRVSYTECKLDERLASYT